ncbi:MAG: replication-relaxation family protein [Pirellulaceae bacterium]
MTVLRYRVVDRETLQQRHFTSGGRTSTQRALTELWRSRHLDKLAKRAVNERDVYFLSRRAPRGLEVLGTLLGEDVPPSRLKRPPAIDHALAVNNFRARVEVAAPEHGLQLVDWRDELDLAVLASRGIVPDAFFQIRRSAAGTERRAGFFVEAELAPVSRRHWARRLSHYATFYYSQQYEAAFSLRSLRVLVITSGAGRQPLSIMEEAEQMQFTPVRVTTWEAVQRTGSQGVLHAPIWRKPRETEPGPLYRDD